MQQQPPPNFGNIFNTVLNAKNSRRRAPRLSDGTHEILLKKYQVRQSDPDKGAANMGNFLAGEFLVASSSDREVREGDSRGWAWFIESTGWGGPMAQTNAKEFIGAVMNSVDLGELPRDTTGYITNPLNGQRFIKVDERGMPIIDQATGQVTYKTEHDSATIGELIVMDFYRGVQIVAVVTPAIDKKTGNRIVSKKDQKPVSNAQWSPGPANQKLADIAKVRAYLDTLDPPEVPAQPNHVQTQQFGGQQQFVQQPPPPAAFVPPPVQPAFVPPQVQPAPPPIQPVASQVPASGPLANVLASLRKQG